MQPCSASHLTTRSKCSESMEDAHSFHLFSARCCDSRSWPVRSVASRTKCSLSNYGSRRDGVVDRKIYAEVPPKVEYALTRMDRATSSIASASAWAASRNILRPGHKSAETRMFSAVATRACSKDCTRNFEPPLCAGAEYFVTPPR